MRFPLIMTCPGELAPYPVPVRRVLLQRAVSLMHTQSKLTTLLEIVLPLCSVTLVTILALWLFGAFTAEPSRAQVPLTVEGNCLGILVGCVLGPLVWWVLRVWQVRPYLRRVVEDYEGKGGF